ncbi:MAG: tRNA pseudouridine(55) synthase TruB [Rhodothalassiaceae bacterium]
MSRRRRGQKVDGWIVLDKPVGLGSTEAVSRVRRLLDAQKAGHGGTLDPLASGVLPIGLGEATKAMAYIVDSSKDYEFTIRWGEARTTDDCEGAVVAVSPVRPGDADIEAALPRFTGEILQAPPAFSAIRQDGVRAYDRARAGETVVLPPRPVSVMALRHLGTAPDRSESRFAMTCGKGTYVRALARDLAQALGTVGHVAALRRTRVGPFSLEHAISLENLEALGHGAPAREVAHPVATALDDIPALAVTEAEARHIHDGQRLRLSTACEGRVRILSDGRLIAVAEVRNGILHPLRVFHL